MRRRLWPGRGQVPERVAQGSSSSSSSRSTEVGSCDSSRCRAAKSVLWVAYFKSRATFCCLAFARPRPIAALAHTLIRTRGSRRRSGAGWFVVDTSVPRRDGDAHRRRRRRGASSDVAVAYRAASVTIRLRMSHSSGGKPASMCQSGQVRRGQIQQPLSHRDRSSNCESYLPGGGDDGFAGFDRPLLLRATASRQHVSGLLASFGRLAWTRPISTR